MMTDYERSILKLLIESQHSSQAQTKFSPEKFCFKEQLAFVTEQARFATAVCSRRAGKTIACAVDLLNTALTNPGSKSLYLTLNRLAAKRILWNDLLTLNRDLELGGEPNEAELVLRFPSGSLIYLNGADHQSEIHKYRGLALHLAIIDEAQSLPNFIEDLVNDVLAKCLFDFHGRCRLVGTPGPVAVGHFYACCVSDAWAHHSWTMFQNPHLKRKSGKEPQELIDLDCARMGVTLSHPKIRRECFGEWVHDPDALVFAYNRGINDYAQLPTSVFPWNYVLGIDLGFDDADAIAVLGWQEHSNKLYLVHEETRSKQSITELCSRLESILKDYPAHRLMIDAGALGKKIAHEIQTRFSLPVIAAEKARKLEYIELLNDALRNKRFSARASGRFAMDCLRVEWDPDHYPPHSKISERYHSDIADAVLYAFRECLHWIEGPAPDRPEFGSRAWVKQQEEMHEEAAKAVLAPSEEDMWGDIRDGD